MATAALADVAARRAGAAAALDEARGAAQVSGAAGLAGRSVRELSMGQRRRAVLAAAWIGTPGTVLLDEPLEAMDRGMRDDILSWVDGLVAQGSLVLVATHDIEPFASRACRAVSVAGGCRTVELPGAAAERIACLESLSRGRI